MNELSERDELMGHISDTFKELNGFRPRGYGDLSIEALRSWSNELSKQIKAEIEAEEEERKETARLIAQTRLPYKPLTEKLKIPSL